MSRRKVTRRRPGREKATASSDVSRPDAADSGEKADELRLDESGFDPAEAEGAERHEMGFDDVIAQLYADGSPALAMWKDRLSEYVDSQGTLDALRLRPTSEQPWPAADNPMLGYLVERTIEMVNDDGLGVAVAWLAVNAWFEGAIAERSRFIRLLDAD